LRRTFLLIFAVALVSRASIAILQFVHGIDFGLNLDSYLYGSFNPGMEIYRDFYGYYLSQVVELSKGLIPYKQIIYTYPPLFLYTLYSFYALGGAFAASIPIWLSDAVTAPVIYLLARQFTSPKLSLIAGLSYAISPFFLLYEGYLWYSSQPMAFFIVLSLYFLFTNRPYWSAILFAIAVLFRQEIIFIFPIYIIWYLMHGPKQVLFRALAIASSIILVVSLPFLIITPKEYLYMVSYAIIPTVTAGSSHVSNSMVSVLGNSVSLTCNTISDTWRSQICNYGNLTYTDAKLLASWSTIFSAGFLNFISEWIFLPLFAATLYNLVRLRKDPGSLILFGALIMTGVLAVLTFEIHSIYRYYLIAVYILPLVISRTRTSMSIAVALPLLSLVFPSGFVQLLFPLLDCLLIVILNQKNSLMYDVNRPHYSRVKTP
jgi:hypothetical protein